MEKKSNNGWVGKIIFLIILIIISLYALVWTGYVRCSSIPGMCSIYWGTQTILSGRQQPSVLIVYNPLDTNGLGNPYLLERLLSDKKSLGMHPNMENINYLSPEKLKNVSLVIVERSRKIATQKLEIFMNYVKKGGRLIWVGDAGVDIGNGDKLLTKGDIDGTVDGNTINGWARLNSDDYLIRFDSFLGVSYNTNYCNVKECTEKTYKIAPDSTKTITIKYPDHENGKLIPSSSHPFVYALKENLPIRDDFAIVTQITPNITPLKIDFGSKLVSDKGTFEEVLPLIVISNANRVAYYALPPEYLAESDDKVKYTSIVENMINGMLK